MIELETCMVEYAEDSWTEASVPGVSVRDLSPEAILGFKNLGRMAGRLSKEELELGPEALLDKLDLIKDGMLNRAAILLFHRSPGKILGPTSLKIGMFEGSDLLYQDEFTGPLIFTANRSVDTLMTKYTVMPISFQGIVRTEVPPYPEPAIREAVMNAIVHNEYSSHVPIQIKVSKEGLTIYNEGGLPMGWTLDKLMGQHKSLLRNPSLATTFYRAGLIESFGRGIGTILSQFKDCPEFEPIFEADSGFSVTFKNELYCKQLAVQGRAGPEKVILDYLAANHSGTYAEITNGTGLSSRQVQRLSGILHEKGLISKQKDGRVIVLRLAD